MSVNTINPFNITKAVDYSDEEIKKYWVDISDGNGFINVLKPQSPMPMFILGGKGSGKTHVMRYFSFNLQKLRYGENFLDSLKKDKYIGIYLRCAGLNSSRFLSKVGTQEAWKNIFAYYIELWFSQLLINIVIDIKEHYQEFDLEIQNNIIGEISEIFDKDVKDQFNSFESFLKYLQKLQKEVDYEVNNIVITGKPITDIRILISPGKAIFGLPEILERLVPILKGFQFIFLIDEFENLHLEQQRYINTLIRERLSPVSFRVGVRWYGVKTYTTFSGKEELKEGSEIEKYVIDSLLRKDPLEYEKFAREICLKRLGQTGFLSGIEHPENKLDEFFEEFDLDKFLTRVKGKEPRHRRSYFSRLEDALKKVSGLGNSQKIIENLTCEENPLIERTNLMLFYREWNSGKDLLKASEKIQKEGIAYLSNPSDQSTSQFKVLEKFKGDLIDQLHRETREPLSYSGIDKLIKMSAGIPRHFLIMLKHIYRWSIYNGENPFSSEKISELSQRKGLIDAAKWFLEDARASGEDGKLMSDSINRIGQYLQDIRFSNIPPECSLSSFSIKGIDIDASVSNILDYLQQYSYLISVNPSRDKNSNNQRVTYQLNGILAPLWELPIYRRGVLSLTTDEVNAIFKPCAETEYVRLKNHRLQNYNAPFRDRGNLSLFE